MIIYNRESRLSSLSRTTRAASLDRAKSLYRGASSRARVTEFMSAAVRALEKAGAGFGDVRREDRTAFVVRVANDQIQSVNEVRRRGWGVRAFFNGAWGYASGTSARSADAVQGARKAVAIARAGAAAGVPTSKLRKMPSTTITLEPKVRIEPRDVSGEDKVAATMEVCRAQKRSEEHTSELQSPYDL